METPDHVEKHPSGLAMCRHCGGEVGEDGFSAEPVESELDAQLKGDTDDVAQQSEATPGTSAEAEFASALRRRNR